MEIINIDAQNLTDIKENKINLVLGFFDGVHLGHQKMILDSIKNYETGVMTFDISPKFAIGKDIRYSNITSLYDKANILEKLGVKYLYVLRVNKELLGLEKIEFIEKVLKRINPKTIYAGSDYRFGKNASGDVSLLKNYFEVNEYPLVKIGDKKVSSREIRNLISEGKMKEVSKLLGRPYQITGLVIEGKHNGEKIGFPTANLELNFPYVLPKLGVYTGYVKLLNSRYKAIISMSTHPTIQELNDPIIEVHLLSYKGDLYGKEIEVQFVEYIREIKKFASMDELASQLEKDKEYAKNSLK